MWMMAAARVHFACRCCGEQVWVWTMSALAVLTLCGPCHRHKDTLVACQERHINEYVESWAEFHEYKDSLSE